MDISYTAEQERYREKAREWLSENVPTNRHSHDFEEKVKTKLEWERKLYEGGYAGITWPKENGGQGEKIISQIIFNEESGKLNAPVGLNVIGTNILGPTLLEIGTEEQKNRFIPKILKGEEIWCQGFSEPNAGSDLASLSTKAELQNGKWVINGQKTWASWSQYADHCILLARTDNKGKKHEGITFFLVPMDTEGITVKPLVQMGGDKEFSEIFFDDVKIDEDLVLGKVNEGWKVAMRALSHERGTNPLGKQARFYKELLDLTSLSIELKREDGETILNNKYYRQKLADSFVEVKVLHYLGLQIANKILKDEEISVESSVQKLYWSEYHKKFGDLAMEIQGKKSIYWRDDGLMGGSFQEIFLHSRAETIYAGTSEIQKNIIAERILGMPR